jgi:cell wall-associated NlpC family hydrolase
VIGITQAGRATPSESSRQPSSATEARIDVDNLDLAAIAIEQEAIAGGAMRSGPRTLSPARIILASTAAMTRMALSEDPSLRPSDTTAIMGPVPTTISHHLRSRPSHRRIAATHTLAPVVAAIPDSGSSGIGHNHTHDRSHPARYQVPDGVFVDPDVQAPKPPTIGLVALRTALEKLGQPYVWGGAGPVVFDCSGLVQWAYAHAGIRLVHHAADQWNQGRLIPGRDILPGDLIMFGHPIFHVGMYLGAGWMINAPFTGQYVNVVPVPTRVAGVVRP